MSFHETNIISTVIMGFQIDEPYVFIPWSLSVERVTEFFLLHPISRITEKYYVMYNVRVLKSLKCNIGLHFGDTLNRIEFFRDEYNDIIKSYDEFQNAFESVFGKPNMQKRGSEGFNDNQWIIADKVRIIHNITERFGITEYLYIERI